jgi:uncharacterized protein DUF6084
MMYTVVTRFQVDAAAPVALSVAPSISLRVHVTCTPPLVVHALVLRARIRIDGARRTYTASERARLFELFGAPEQWQKTMSVPLSWAEVGVSVGRFEGSTMFDIIVPCTYDLAAATTKLCDALDGGDVPLTTFLSGTLFAETTEGDVVVTPIAADGLTCTLPISTWRGVMDAHHPRGALVSLPRALLDRIRRAGEKTGATSLERAIEKLLDTVEAPR